MDDEAARRAETVAEALRASTQEQAERLAALLKRTARALDTSAALAAQHAQRREREGKGAAAKKENEAARRASDAAEHARVRAEALLEFRRRLAER